jgi:protein-tyrosine phosphatase
VSASRLSPSEVDSLVEVTGRRIDEAGAVNLRDIGGYPSADGGSTRWRMLLRSDAPRPDAPDALAAYGLRTVVDLRTPEEIEFAPSPRYGGAPALLAISLLGGDLQKVPTELTAIYRFLIGERGALIGAAVRAISEPGALPALVHCTAGKDRTGLVIALVLAVLGVPDEVIAADYAISARNLNARAAEIRAMQESSERADELTPSLTTSPPAVMLDILDQVRAMAGSADGYLLSNGVSPAQLAFLRTSLST